MCPFHVVVYLWRTAFSCPGSVARSVTSLYMRARRGRSSSDDTMSRKRIALWPVVAMVRIIEMDNIIICANISSVRCY